MNEESPPAAAILKTDPELEYRLGRADALAARGEYIVVIPLWQEALDASHEVMFTRDGELYRPIGLEIEQSICALPPQALRAYRLTADGQVAALLAEAHTLQEREAALAQIVQRYFLSSQGDEAAYELACRALDRHDFVYAAHLLTRILEDYPEPSIDRSAAYLRLAVAQVELGARTDAAECMKKYHALRPEAVESALSLSIAAHIEQVPAVRTVKSEAGTWHMRFGTLAGDGVQAALPEAMLSDDLIELWHHDLNTGSAISAPLESSTAGLPPFRGLQDMPRANLPRDGRPAQSQNLRQWAAYQEDAQYSESQPFPLSGHPHGGLLFDENRLYFKTPAGLVCTDAHTGHVLWQGLPSSFAPDLNTELYNWLKAQGHSLTAPSDTIHLYGDRTNQGMAIDEGQIFSIEGDAEKHRIDFGVNGYELMQSGVPRTRYNFLTAYQADTGKVLWQFPGGREFYRDGRTEENPGFYKIGFMGPPAPMTRMVLAPVSCEGGLWLYAIDRRDGSLTWRTFLCEELPNATDPWAPVGIAVEGGEVYVSTGSSAVLALDARTGAVRWALHYSSIVPYNGFRGFFNGSSYANEVRVWEDNALIIYGNAVIIMASDSDRIQARDRRNGGLLWESPGRIGENSAVYCLGMRGDRLYVASSNVIRCLEVTDHEGNPNNGRIAWEIRFDSRQESISFGRGIVTEQDIFLPQHDKILRIDPVTGEILDQIVLTRPEDIARQGDLSFLPVGNLYSDGHWLHMVSPGRISAWGTAELRQEAWALPDKQADDAEPHPQDGESTETQSPVTNASSLPTESSAQPKR